MATVTWTDERFDGVNVRLDRLEDGFTRMDAKFDALQRTMFQVGGGLIGTLIVALITLLATH